MAEEEFEGFERYKPELTENERFFDLFGGKKFIPHPKYPEVMFQPTIEDLYQIFKERLITELAEEDLNNLEVKR